MTGDVSGEREATSRAVLAYLAGRPDRWHSPDDLTALAPMRAGHRRADRYGPAATWDWPDRELLGDVLRELADRQLVDSRDRDGRAEYRAQATG